MKRKMDRAIFLFEDLVSESIIRLSSDERYLWV